MQKPVAKLVGDRDRFLDTNDRAVVMDVKGDFWAAAGLPKDAADWLQKNV